MYLIFLIQKHSQRLGSKNWKQKAFSFTADSGPRIISGSVAAPGQFPHQVFNVFNIPEGLAVCGASLLCDSWVLTAAHCAQE